MAINHVKRKQSQQNYKKIGWHMEAGKTHNTVLYSTHAIYFTTSNAYT